VKPKESDQNTQPLSTIIPSRAEYNAPDERVVKNASDLPNGFFRLKNVQFNQPGDNVTDADLVRFKGLTALHDVHLNRAKVTDAGPAHFGGSTTIASLEWGGNPAITGTGLVHFAKCRELQSIQFFGTPLTDEGLAHLKGFTKLTHANLSGTKLTDASAEVFESWPLLNHMSLGQTAVTDATLERLTKLDQLRVLNVQKTGATEAGVKKLAAALPLCKIEWDGVVINPAKK
jgi:hypothetical protein